MSEHAGISIVNEELLRLREENALLRTQLGGKTEYIREKINQLLSVMGTLPLRPEELDDDTLVDLDPIGILSGSFAQILSHQKETNQELSEKREFLQSILASLESGIVIIREQDHLIVEVNATAARIVGLPAAEIVGNVCFQNICPACEGKCPIKDLGQEIDNSERVLLTGDGRRIPVLKTVGKVVLNGIPHFIESFVDMSALKNVEFELAAEKQLLSVTLQSLGEGVIATDTEGKVLLINPVAEQLTGWLDGKAKGSHLPTVYNLVDEKTGNSHCSVHWQRLLAGERVNLSHALLIPREGEGISVACSASPLFDQDGSIIGAVIVFRDNTQQRRMEEEMQRSQKLESVGVLAGGIAHDFNNLLTSILGNLSLAQEYIAPANQASQNLKGAERATLRARDLTQQLLTFSKGGAPVRKSSSIIDIIKESSSFALRGSRVLLKFVPADDLWPANVDVGQVSQVIHNLILNASQAMPCGGEIVASVENISIQGDAVQNLAIGDYLHICITDTGCGIPEAIISRIFDPYFTTKKKGSGLGLASSYSIIANHGGTITVDSQEGKGTSFHVYLPASSGKMISDPKRVVAPPLSGKGRVLVMDDDELVREILVAMLEHLGYEPLMTESGEETVERYREAAESGTPIDAIIMDLTVPGGMGGLQAMSIILASDPQARGIVSSGYCNDPVMADYREYGFLGVVSKPYRLEELGEVLNSVVNVGGRQS